MSGSQRRLSLEMLKAAGILYLIMLHQTGWLFVKDDTGGLRVAGGQVVLDAAGYRSGLHLLGFLLPMLAGAAHYLAVTAGRYPGWSVVRRSVLLWALGTAMNVLAWGPSETLTWDVLQFLALAILISQPFLVPRLGAWGPAAAFAASLLPLAFAHRYPFLQHAPAYWYRIIVGDIRGEYYWPLCPWYSLFAAGLLLGAALRMRNRAVLAALFLAGLAGLACSIGGGAFLPGGTAEFVWGSALFKPPPLFVIGIIGFGFAAVPALELLVSRYPALGAAFERSWLAPFSRGILWIYLVSIVVGWHATAAWLAGHPAPTLAQSLGILSVAIAGQCMLAYAVGRAACLARTRAAAGHPPQGS